MISLQQLIYKKNHSTVFRMLLHIAAWVVYWAVSYYFNTISYNIFASTRMTWMEPLFNILNLIIFYYPLMYVTVPIIFKQKKYFAGILLLIVQVLIYTILYEIAERQLITFCTECSQILSTLPQALQTKPQLLLNGIMSSFFSLGAVYILIARLSPVIAIKVSLDFVREKIAAVELEKDNLQLEFNFLKSQVNPHFLFNTLNNIHSLVVQQRNEQASGTIAKLSDFLRHSLYDTGGENILLSTEIRLLEDYIALEKLRLNKTVVKMHTNLENELIMVPPLLFIPLVENAFKYSADHLTGKSFIEISIVQKNKTLQFQITNTYDPVKRAAGKGGIGLQNLRKRLQYYYQGKHDVVLKDAANIFSIHIAIIL